MTKKSPDAAAIASQLKHEGIVALYHFTSIENLPGIADAQALCSKQDLEDMGKWPPPEPGGNDVSLDLDRKNNNWDKVSLNFTTCTPMAYGVRQEKHLCFFVVSILVAEREGVTFTNTNAAAGNQDRAVGIDGLNLVNFDAIRSDPRPGDKDGWHRPVQAEVLVPGRISLTDVTEVVFVSQASMEEGVRLWGGRPHPSFRVEERFFANYPRAARPNINFPFLQRVVLTDDIVGKENASALRNHKT